MKLRQMVDSFRRQTGVGASLVAALLTAVVVSAALVTAHRSGAAPATYTHALGAFQYTVARDPQTGQAGALISYPHDTRSDLEGYISTNRRLLGELRAATSGSIPVRVVFSHPISPQEFTGLVETYNLTVDRYVLRGVSRDGTRITIFGAPSGSELVPEIQFSQAEHAIQEHDATSQVLGIVTVDGSINVGDAARMSTHPDVAVVDVAIAATRLRVAAGSGQAAEAIVVDNPLQLYWWLENADLVHDAARSAQ